MLKTKTYATLSLLTALAAGVSPAAQAAGGASPDEISAKVAAAAELLAQDGAAGLAALNDRDGPWVWKDTYVFALDCGARTLVAHPVQPELIGRNLADIKDSKGNEFLVYMCLAAKVPGGGWVEYWWPLPSMGVDQAVRKISYIMQVEGTPYQVAAGVYDENVSLWELNQQAD